MSQDTVQTLKMDSCVAVEKEIDRVINRFTAINEHSSQVIGDVVNHILELKCHLEEGKQQPCSSSSIIVRRGENGVIRTDLF